MLVEEVSDPARSVRRMNANSLSDEDRLMLALERKFFAHRGSKEQAIRDVFGWTPTRYYQRLAALADRPAALAHDPLTVKRLQRMKDRRKSA